MPTIDKETKYQRYQTMLEKLQEGHDHTSLVTWAQEEYQIKRQAATQAIADFYRHFLMNIKVSREIERAKNISMTMKLYKDCLSKKKPDHKTALSCVKHIADLRGLKQADEVQTQKELRVVMEDFKSEVGDIKALDVTPPAESDKPINQINRVSPTTSIPSDISDRDY